MASDAIRQLDEDLAEEGEDIILRRIVGSASQVFIDVKVRARVTGVAAEELEGTVSQNEFLCIFSPTEINLAQWPGGQAPSVVVDPRIPDKSRGDKAYVRGTFRAVQYATGFYPQGELVRIEMRVLG